MSIHVISEKHSLTFFCSILLHLLSCLNPFENQEQSKLKECSLFLPCKSNDIAR